MMIQRRRVDIICQHLNNVEQHDTNELKDNKNVLFDQKVKSVQMHCTAGNNSKKVFKDPQAEAVGLKAQDLFSVKDKIALVTGGSKGIGKMIAEGLVANGAIVYICSRKADVCEETAKELNEKYNLKNAARSLPGDLSSLSGVEALVQAFSSKEDKLHILINNAGATYGAPLEEYPDSAWEKVMNLNVRHVFNLTKLLLPQLKKGQVHADPARVINIASTDGVRAQQTMGPTAAFAYTTSKGAVVHLTKALCRALSPYNISVNCIAPGVFPSNMTKFFLQDENLSKMQAKSNPLKRTGRTADMAGTALYLCSPAGAWTNGSVIVVDGGSFLHDSGMFASSD